MIIEDHWDVTKSALAVMDRTQHPWLREILHSLIGHLQAFVRDVGWTEKEFQAATDIVNRIGQASTDTHNEAVLMAGSLGSRRWSACSTTAPTG
ncbi:dioxygenase [Streptomyces griseoruber]